MKEFFIQYWRLLFEALLVILSFIFMVVRKKPVKVVENLSTLICRLLPGLINEAETEFGSGCGSAKLKFVLDGLVILLKECGYSDEAVDSYLPWAKDQVEVILSTPKKKGF